jgi:hypothetical protein
MAAIVYWNNLRAKYRICQGRDYSDFRRQLRVAQAGNPYSTFGESAANVPEPHDAAPYQRQPVPGFPRFEVVAIFLAQVFEPFLAGKPTRIG